MSDRAPSRSSTEHAPAQRVASEPSRLAGRHAAASAASGASSGDGPHSAILALQRMAGNQATTRALRGLQATAGTPLRAGGSPLDTSIRGEMERRFGHDFSDVRVHTDRSAAASALDLGAKAYTFGRNIVFNEGRYAPESASGQRLLAHELAHVVQQSRGGRAPAADTEQPLETDAEGAAEAVTRGAGPVEVSNASGVGIARAEDDKVPLWKRALNPLYQKTLKVLPPAQAQQLEQLNEAARLLVTSGGIGDEQLNAMAKRMEPAIKAADAIITPLAEKKDQEASADASTAPAAKVTPPTPPVQQARPVKPPPPAREETVEDMERKYFGFTNPDAKKNLANFIETAGGPSYDPSKISYEALLAEYYTTKNRLQGGSSVAVPEYEGPAIGPSSEPYDRRHRYIRVRGGTLTGLDIMVTELKEVYATPEEAEEMQRQADLEFSARVNYAALGGVAGIGAARSANAGAGTPAPDFRPTIGGAPVDTVPSNARSVGAGPVSGGPSGTVPLQTPAEWLMEGLQESPVTTGTRKPYGFQSGRATPGRNIRPGTLEGLEPTSFEDVANPRGQSKTRQQQLEGFGEPGRANPKPFMDQALGNVSDSDHPLHKLVKPTDKPGEFDWHKTTRETKSGKTQTGRYQGSETDPIVQAGHKEAYAARGTQEFMLEDADLNQLSGQTIESKGAYSTKERVLVTKADGTKGVWVEMESLQQWERLGVVPAGTVARAIKGFTAVEK